MSDPKPIAVVDTDVDFHLPRRTSGDPRRQFRRHTWLANYYRVRRRASRTTTVACCEPTAAGSRHALPVQCVERLSTPASACGRRDR
jgi:hypothetical protein